MNVLTHSFGADIQVILEHLVATFDGYGQVQVTNNVIGVREYENKITVRFLRMNAASLFHVIFEQNKRKKMKVQRTVVNTAGPIAGQCSAILDVVNSPNLSDNVSDSPVASIFANMPIDFINEENVQDVGVPEESLDQYTRSIFDVDVNIDVTAMFSANAAAYSNQSENENMMAINERITEMEACLRLIFAIESPEFLTIKGLTKHPSFVRFNELRFFDFKWANTGPIAQTFATIILNMILRGNRNELTIDFSEINPYEIIDFKYTENAGSTASITLPGTEAVFTGQTKKSVRTNGVYMANYVCASNFCSYLLILVPYFGINHIPAYRLFPIGWHLNYHNRPNQNRQMQTT